MGKLSLDEQDLARLLPGVSEQQAGIRDGRLSFEHPKVQGALSELNAAGEVTVGGERFEVRASFANGQLSIDFQ